MKTFAIFGSHRIIELLVVLFGFQLFPIHFAFSQEANQLTDDEIASGWIQLFDGETLFGWKSAGSADWQVADGTIRCESGESCLLRTTSQFDDFELHVEFKATAQTNSGVFLRTSPKPRNVTADCYELNIAPADNPFPTGSFVQRQHHAGETDDQWHAFDVVAEAGKFQVQLDGETVLEYDDPTPTGKGYIGLQYREGPIQFRNVKLRPLGLNSIFNGQDLSEWKTYPQMASEYSVTPEGWLHVKNGRGQLESNGKYGDFVLQYDCRTNGLNLNSGVFFRCIPGDEMMGYECQIHNGYKDNDRTSPLDCGTGGIFRRIDARRVVSDDHQWFKQTLIVDGPHVASWVNGYPVTDWTDTRQPNQNPRRGLRTEAGTLMIQGHDPTTDIDFRNLNVREIQARWSD